MGTLVCCANEPFARGLPCGKRARCSSPVETPSRLRASSFRMQGRGFLLQQICDREQIETVEHSAAGVRQLLDAALTENYLCRSLIPGIAPGDHSSTSACQLHTLDMC